MRDDAEAAQTPDIVDDIARFSAERIRRSRQVERDVVAAGRADFDGVEHSTPLR